MKFDFVIGNPPYQDNKTGDNETYAPPVYQFFMNAAFAIAKRVQLITPARFLFNAGSTSKYWNHKMLTDQHFMILDYMAKSSDVFRNTEIKGGVVISYRDTTKVIGPIKRFIPIPELKTILEKVQKHKQESITSIIHNQTKFNLSELYKVFPSLRSKIGSDGNDKRMTGDCLTFPCFHVKKESNTDIKIIGLLNTKREWRYINEKFIEHPNANLNKYKVIVPSSNGSGAIGEVLSTPLIGEPLIGYTRTFIGFGAFKLEEEANNCLKYIKSKFCRVLLGILKITQSCKRSVWKYVPLQDFSKKSGIDWEQSIRMIDEQLYQVYQFDKKEIDFIEKNIKEMV